MKRGKLYTDIHVGTVPCEDEGRDLQAKKWQRSPGNHHKLGERLGTDSNLYPSEEHNFPNTLIFHF